MLDRHIALEPNLTNFEDINYTTKEGLFYNFISNLKGLIEILNTNFVNNIIKAINAYYSSNLTQPNHLNTTKEYTLDFVLEKLFKDIESIEDETKDEIESNFKSYYSIYMTIKKDIITFKDMIHLGTDRNKKYINYSKQSKLRDIIKTLNYFLSNNDMPIIDEKKINIYDVDISKPYEFNNLVWIKFHCNGKLNIKFIRENDLNKFIDFYNII